MAGTVRTKWHSSQWYCHLKLFMSCQSASERPQHGRFQMVPPLRPSSTKISPTPRTKLVWQPPDWPALPKFLLGTFLPSRQPRGPAPLRGHQMTKQAHRSQGDNCPSSTQHGVFSSSIAGVSSASLFRQ